MDQSRKRGTVERAVLLNILQEMKEVSEEKRYVFIDLVCNFLNPHLWELKDAFDHQAGGAVMDTYFCIKELIKTADTKDDPDNACLLYRPTLIAIGNLCEQALDVYEDRRDAFKQDIIKHDCEHCLNEKDYPIGAMYRVFAHMHYHPVKKVTNGKLSEDEVKHLDAEELEDQEAQA